MSESLPLVLQGPPWYFLGSLSAQVALLIVWAAGLSLALRRSTPRLRHLVWLVVLLRLALPVAFSSPWGVFPALSSGSVTVEALIGSLVGGPVPAEALPSPLASATAIAAQAVLLLYLAGVLLMGWLVVLRSVRLKRVISRESVPASPGLLGEITALCRDMGLKRVPHVRVVQAGSNLPGPALFGLFRPTILLPPADSRLYDKKLLEPVLVHELVHLRRRDHWVNALQWLVQTLYFFHPLVWWANRRLRAERELVCDDEVARRCGKKTYLAALVTLAESRLTCPETIPASIAMAESPRLLPRRIRRMSTMKTADDAPNARTRALLIAVLVLALLPLLLACSQPPASGPEAKPPTSTAATGGEDGSPFMPGVDGVTEPKLVHQVSPKYPEEARKAKVDGKVILQIVVKANGEVGKIEIFKEPEKKLGLAESAVTAVRQWRYEPATLDGQPVDVYVTVVVSFKLDSNKQKGEEEPSA